jgi:hypothetical protein
MQATDSERELRAVDREALSKEIASATLDQLRESVHAGTIDRKLVHVSQRAFPPGSCQLAEFQVVVHEIASRLLTSATDSFKRLKVKPEQVFLCDNESQNAAIDTCTHDLFFSRGLIASLLNAPEMRDGSMSIDALAGIIAHELGHAAFQQNFNARGNSMLQEEWCDKQAATMMERAGFKPEAMTLAWEMINRTSRFESSIQVLNHGQVHASIPIRSELYEKLALDAYERDRRKEVVEGLTGESLPRDSWRQRLEAVLDSAGQVHVIAPVDLELHQRLSGSQSPRDTIAALGGICREYRDLLSRRTAIPLLADVCTHLALVLRGDAALISEVRRSPDVDSISEALWHNQEGGVAAGLYDRQTEVFGFEGWGIFAGFDTKVVRFITASSRPELVDAMSVLEGALKLLKERGVFLPYPRGDQKMWLTAIAGSGTEEIQRVFTREDFDRLQAGDVIPFPFQAHRTLRAEIASNRQENADRSVLDMLMRFCGISEAIDSLLTGVHIHPLCEALRRGTDTDSLSGFSISERSGVSIEFPQRVSPIERAEDDGRDIIVEGGAWVDTERRFARFMLRRGEKAAAEIGERPLSDSAIIRNLLRKHGWLIAPQVHPFGLVDPEQLRATHQLARQLVEAISRAVKAVEEQESGRNLHGASVRSIILDSAQALAGQTNQVYWRYLRDVTEMWEGARVDPEHPLVRYVRLDPDRVFSRGERLIIVSGLNGLDSAPLHSWGEERVRDVFAECLGSERRLRYLLGVNTCLSPEEFAETLTRVPRESFTVHSSRGANRAQALIDARAYYINEHLRELKQREIPLPVLHVLADLCGRASGWKLLDTVLEAAESAHGNSPHSAALGSPELLDRYQRLAAMGAIGRSPQMQKRLHRELEGCYAKLNGLEARLEFVSALLTPRTFVSGDYGYFPLPDFLYEKRWDWERAGSPPPSSVYTVRTSDPSFEKFLVKSSVECLAALVREAVGIRHDDGSKAFRGEVEKVVSFLNDKHVPAVLRVQILDRLADELLTQAPVSEYLRDNLVAPDDVQGKLTAHSLLSASHQTPEALNAGAVEVHNALVQLRTPGASSVREAIFDFLLDRSPSDERVWGLAEQILRELDGGFLSYLTGARSNGDTQRWLKTGAPRPAEPVVAFHLKALHQRFSELGIRAKGALLSTLATDQDSPGAARFEYFKRHRLFPAVLSGVEKWGELLKSAIDDYFEFYGSSLHQKFMVGCSILAGAGSGARGEGDGASVGRIARLFLGAHGPAGFKMLQRIRNHPDTPRAVKDELYDVLDETVKYPRWTIHELIARYGPKGASEAWVGRAKAGSMCLSVELKNGAGSSFLSIIHPGAHVDSQYWLGNFAIMGSKLGERDKRLSLLAPMASQAKSLLTNECDFAYAPQAQQEVAEQGYTYEMRFPLSRITVRSECAPLIASEAKPDPDFMKVSGNKEVQAAVGLPLLQLISEFRKRAGRGEMSPDEQDRQFSMLQAAAFSVIANEVRLILAGRGKDHDRHPGNYLIDLTDGPEPIVRLTHFDFGCTDLSHPTAEARAELREMLRPFVSPLGLLKLSLWPKAVSDSLCRKLFESSAWSSLPLGLHASLGANEVVTFRVGERQLLSRRDLLRAFIVALESGDIAPEVAQLAPKGVFGIIVSRVLKLVDAGGVGFAGR